jgi:hypothetical protein
VVAPIPEPIVEPIVEPVVASIIPDLFPMEPVYQSAPAKKIRKRKQPSA